MVVVRGGPGSAVFDVAQPHWGSVVDWAEQQRLVTISRRAVDAPSVTAWALLDGGILRLYGYGLTTVRAGVYILGSDALRLVLSDLGLALPGASGGPPDVEELRRRARRVPDADPSLVEQAELLATCTDDIMLRLVSATLRAESHAGRPMAGQEHGPSPADPAYAAARRSAR